MMRVGTNLWVSDGRQLFLLELLDGLLVLPQVQFGSHQNNGGVLTVVTHFWVPLKHYTCVQT